MFTPKANSKHKRVKKTQEHEKRYVVTRLITRRGELEASKHCSLPRIARHGELEASKHCSLPRIARRGELEASKYCSLSKSANFNPKNPIFINLNPKTDWKHNL